MDNKVYVTWERVERYINSLVKRLEEEGKLKDRTGIFTFPRGGLILAVLLSQKTGLPLLMNPVNHCIIIDDIIDTGITMKKYSDLRKEKDYYITTMFAHISQLDEMAEYQCEWDFFAEVKDKEWIVYPWEEF